MLFGTIKSVATSTLILSLACTAHAVLVTDAALVNTSQIRSETNNPVFNGTFTTTQQVAGLNLYYSTQGNAVAVGTLNGIGFHNLDLSATTSGTGLALSNAAPGVTLDYNFGCGADCPGSRNLTTTIGGPVADAAVANTLTAGNRYLTAAGSGHDPNVVTFHGLTGGAPVYVQLIGGQHGWGGTMSIYVNGNGVNPATGILEIPDWTSNRTNNLNAGILGFLTTAQPNGDLTLGFQSNNYTGLSAVILQQQLTVPEPSTFMLLGMGAIGLAIQARRRRAVA